MRQKRLGRALVIISITSLVFFTLPESASHHEDTSPVMSEALIQIQNQVQPPVLLQARSCPAPPPDRQSSNVLHRFCSGDPFEAICFSTHDGNEFSPKTYSQEDVTQVHKTVVAQAERLYGVPNPSFLDPKVRLDGELLEDYISYLEKVENLYGVPDIQPVLFSRAKENLANAIDRNPTIAATDKARLKEALESTQIYTPSQYLRKFPGELNTLEARCGDRKNYPFFSKRNAFYNSQTKRSVFTHPKKETYRSVIVCPGEFAYDHLTGALNKELLATLAHELGHSIDPREDILADEYGVAFECVRKSLRGISESQMRDWTNEAASDQWLAEALAETLRETRSMFGPGQILARNLVHSLRGFCDGKRYHSSSTHPPSDLRVSLISGNANLREALGCTEPVGFEGCGLFF